MVIQINEIMDILEMGYTNEEKAELLRMLFDEESKKVFDRGWKVGYDRGTRDKQTPSGW